MSTLALSLTRSTIQKEVQKTHAAITTACLSELQKVGCKQGQTALLDYLPLSGKFRSLKMTAVEFNAVKGILLNPAQPLLSALKIYDMPEVGIVEARQKFVQAVLKAGKGHLLTKIGLTADEVRELSTFSNTPSTLLAIKAFWLTEGYHEDDFDAYPAMTDPVRKFTKFLWGNDFRNAKMAHDFTKSLVEETGLNQLNVNTALWVMGNRM